jgi:hypothetical protein
MNDKTTFVFLPILNMISFTSIVPIMQAIAATLTIIIGIKQIIKGLRDEGSLWNYTKSFFKKK